MPGLTAMEYQDAQRWTWSVDPWKQVAGCKSHQERGGTATGGILQVSFVITSKRKVVSVIDHSQWKHEVHEIIYYRIEFCDSSKKTKEYWKKTRKWGRKRKWKNPSSIFYRNCHLPHFVDRVWAATFLSAVPSKEELAPPTETQKSAREKKIHWKLRALYQVIQAVTFWSPSWRSLNHLKGPLNHPKKVTLNHKVMVDWG